MRQKRLMVAEFAIPCHPAEVTGNKVAGQQPARGLSRQLRQSPRARPPCDCAVGAARARENASNSPSRAPFSRQS